MTGRRNLTAAALKLAVALTVAACAFSPRAGTATYIATFSGGTLTITITQSDTVRVTGVTDGNVMVNGFDVSPPTLASAVQFILVTGSSGADIIDLGSVTNGNGFTGFSGATVNAGGGADEITGTAFTDVLNGEAGNDTFFTSAGSDRLDGAAGNDQYRITATPASGATITILDTGGGTNLLYYDAYPSFIHELNITDSAGQITGTGIGTVNYSGATIYDKFVEPRLTVSGGALSTSFLTGDAIFSVSGGSVQINGRNPAGGAKPANTITSILVDCLSDVGTGNDINLSAVTAAAFPAMTGATINARRGADTITGSDFADTVDGGRGDDTFYSSKGNDTLNGNTGNDTFYLNSPAAGATVAVDGDGASLPDYNGDGTADYIVCDALNHSVTDNGSSFSGGGMGTINYVNVESRDLIGLPVPQIRFPLLADDSRTTAVFLPKDSGKAGWAKVTLRNVGYQDVVITGISIVDNPSGYFGFIGAAPAVPITLTPGGSRPILLQFNPGVTVTEALARLKTVSNDMGAPGTESFVGLRAGTSVDTLWNAFMGNDFDNIGNWSTYVVPFSHLKIPGIAPSVIPTKATGNLTLGIPTDASRMTISGGGLIVGTGNALNLSLASSDRGICEVTQTAGNVTVSNNLLISAGEQSVSTYTLSGGTVKVSATTNIGQNGTGVLVLSGSGALQAQTVTVGGGAQGDGRLNASGGSLVSMQQTNVGGDGLGALNISGTANVAAGSNLVFGNGVTGRGSFNMSGGTLYAETITAGPGTIDSWNWTNGTIRAGAVSLPITVTNNGGTLTPGGTGIGTTAFNNGTSYTQAAGGKLVINIDNTGAADQVIVSGGRATLAGTIQVVLLNGGPTTHGSWDIVTAQAGGSISVGAVAVTLPAGLWSVTSDSTRITVRLDNAPKLAVPGASNGIVPFRWIFLSKGDTVSTNTLLIQNEGDLNLNITGVTVTGTSFTLVHPTPAELPKVLTGGATDLVTMTFECVTTGTYIGGLTINNNSTSPTYILTLRARVLESPIVASGVESWTRY